MTVPDFLIIGAMKSGTSTLQAQLVGQQGVFMTTPKEPNYFSDDAVFAKGADWYSTLYAQAAPDDLKGEASTHYTKLPTYPETVTRLAAAQPNPKLIYVIRNPVERAVSHYIHEWTMGEMGTDAQAEFAAHTTLIDYGRYAMQIAPFISQFGKNSVCLTSLEQLKSDPQSVLNTVGTFLGIKGPLTWQNDQAQMNASAERIRRLPLHGLLIDNPVAEFLRRTLVPQALRDRIRKSRQMTTRPELPDALIAELETVFAQDHSDLAQMFPDHPALSMCYPFVAQ